MALRLIRPFLGIVASLLVGLLLCELALRLFGAYLISPKRTALSVPGTVNDYLKQIPVAHGVDRAWFGEELPELPNRSKVDPKAVQLYDDYVKRGLYGPQSFYIWNRRYVLDNMCRGAGSTFDKYPPDILAFDPPSGTPFPRFRFPANKALPSGLVTNSFGWRGPEISLRKPPKTIRIAFVGASTTIDNHNYKNSYPELVGYWLNRYLTTKASDARVEIINAGREGIGSTDVEAIVREEILPLEPDFVVYYEGANQFDASSILNVHLSRFVLRPGGLPDVHAISPFLTGHSVLAKLVDTVLTDRANELREPSKPGYTFRWPQGLSESAPNVTRPDLPLNLVTILKDFDRIREDLAPQGGQLILSSYIWLARDGMVLSRMRHPHIYEQLNGVLWPLRYADTRRLADFQNTVFRNYALQHKLSFLDVAGVVPRDPDLFVDGIHMTESGCRLRAWVVLQGLVPVIQKELDSKRLPHAPSNLIEKDPAPREAMPMRIDCNAPTDSAILPGAIDLKDITLAYDKASLSRDKIVKIVTAPEQGAFAAAVAVRPAGRVATNAWVRVRVNVLSGQIGLGVLNETTRTFLAEYSVKPSGRTEDLYIAVPSLEHAGLFIIRTTASSGVKSEVTVEDLAILVPRSWLAHHSAAAATGPEFAAPGVRGSDPALPADAVRLPGAIRLDGIQLAYDKAVIERTNPIRIVTAPQRWAYAAALPITGAADVTTPCWVSVRARVVSGEIGVGVLDDRIRDFQIEKFVRPEVRPVNVDLYVRTPEHASMLIIRNTADGGPRSEVLLEDAALFVPKSWAEKHPANLAESVPRGMPPLDASVVAAIPLNRFKLAYEKASIQQGTPMRVKTAPQRWAYAATVPLAAGGSDQLGFVDVRARVTRGQIGFGILNRKTNSFLSEIFLDSNAAMQDVYIPLRSSLSADDLVVRNTAADSSASEVLIERVTILGVRK